MGRLARDGTAEPVSRDQIFRHARGQGNINFPCSADHEQDWQPYPVDPYSAICDDYTYIHTYMVGPCMIINLIAMPWRGCIFSVRNKFIHVIEYPYRLVKCKCIFLHQ